MTRWDYNEDFNREEDPEEEARLLKKFNEYADLEKYEKNQKTPLKKPHVAVALIEGTILVGLVSAFLILWNYQ